MAIRQCLSRPLDNVGAPCQREEGHDGPCAHPPAMVDKVFCYQLTKTMMNVHDELRRAMQKFPIWSTDPLHALAVLQEEVGELSKAVLQHTYEPHKQVTRDDIHAEAIQCAAMCLRFLLSLHRYDFTPSPQHRQE